MDIVMLQSMVIEIRNDVYILRNQVIGLDNQLRDIDIRTRGMRGRNGSAIDPDLQRIVDTFNNKINVLECRIDETNQHLEDLHYDLEKGDVGQIYLTKSLLDRLVVNDNVKVVGLAAGERSEPKNEEGHDE